MSYSLNFYVDTDDFDTFFFKLIHSFNRGGLIGDDVVDLGDGTGNKAVIVSDLCSVRQDEAWTGTLPQHDFVDGDFSQNSRGHPDLGTDSAATDESLVGADARQVVVGEFTHHGFLGFSEFTAGQEDLDLIVFLNENGIGVVGDDVDSFVFDVF